MGCVGSGVEPNHAFDFGERHPRRKRVAQLSQRHDQFLRGELPVTTEAATQPEVPGQPSA
jgi:hypothetical protein